MQRERVEPGLRALSPALVNRAAPLSLSPSTTLPVCHELSALPVLAEKAAYVELQVTARLNTRPTGTATADTVRRAREARWRTGTPSTVVHAATCVLDTRVIGSVAGALRSPAEPLTRSGVAPPSARSSGGAGRACGRRGATPGLPPAPWTGCGEAPRVATSAGSPTGVDPAAGPDRRRHEEGPWACQHATKPGSGSAGRWSTVTAPSSAPAPPSSPTSPPASRSGCTSRSRGPAPSSRLWMPTGPVGA